MIVTLRMTHGATVVRARSRNPVDVHRVVSRAFEIPSSEPGSHAFVTTSGTEKDFLDERYDWFEKDGRHWRVLGDETEGLAALEHILDDRSRKLRSIATVTEQSQNTITEDAPLRELLRSDEEEIATLLQDWLSREAVVIDGRIAVAAEVPVLDLNSFDKNVGLTGSYHLMPQDLRDMFPLCVWDLDARTLRRLVSRRDLHSDVRRTVEKYEHVAPSPFDRRLAVYRYLANRHASSDRDMRSAKAGISRPLRQALDRRASADDLAVILHRTFGNDEDLRRIARVQGACASVDFTLPEVPRDRVVSITVDGIQHFLEVPRVATEDTRATAVVALRGGRTIDVRRMGKEWLTRLSSFSIDGSPLRPGSMELRSKGTLATEYLRKLRDRLHGDVRTKDPLRVNEILASFASSHLVDLDGILHMRSDSEPVIVVGPRHVTLQPVRLATLERDLAEWTRASEWPVAISQVGIASELFRVFGPEGERNFPVVDATVLEPSDHRLDTRFLLSRAMTDGVLKAMQGGFLVPKTSWIQDDLVDAFHAAEADTEDQMHRMDRIRDPLTAFVEDIGSLSIYRHVAGTPAFLALRDTILPSLRHVMRDEDEMAVAGLRL